MKTIPNGPVLIVPVGPSGAGKSTLIKNTFFKHDIVSTDEIREELLFDKRRQDAEEVVIAEFHRRIRVRLENGVRAVADATHIHDVNRRRTAMIAKDMGLPVVYMVINRSMGAKMSSAGWRKDVRDGNRSLIESHEITFVANEQKILSGDGIADQVIDTRKDQFRVVMPLPRGAKEASAIIRYWKFSGVLVIPDVHGNVTGLKKAIAYAERHNLYMIALGDLVDYTPGTLEAAELYLKVMMDGRGSAVMGNHEKKIHKFVTEERMAKGFQGELGHGNVVTTNLLKAMTPEQRYKWENKFIGLCAMMPHHIVIDDYLFVHGAAMPSFFETDVYRFGKNSASEALAMYGQAKKGEKENGLPVRLLDWVDEIPTRKTVVVGHAVLNDQDVTVKLNAQGGRAIFMDTGSGKDKMAELDGTIRYPNGHLTVLHLEFDKTGVLSRAPVAYLTEDQLSS